MNEIKNKKVSKMKIDYLKNLNILYFTDNTKLINKVLISGIALIVLSFLGGIYSPLGGLGSFKVLFSIVLALFLPGFILSYIFFPFSTPLDSAENKLFTREAGSKLYAVDWMERGVLSFILSILVVPLVVFYLSLIGIRIQFWSVTFEILGVIIIFCVVLRFRLNNLEKLQFS